MKKFFILMILCMMAGVLVANVTMSQDLNVVGVRPVSNTIYSLPYPYAGFIPLEHDKNISPQYRIINSGSFTVTLQDVGVRIYENGNPLFRIEIDQSITLAPGEQSDFIDRRGYIMDNYTNNQTTTFSAVVQYRINDTWFNVAGNGSSDNFTVNPRPALQNEWLVKSLTNPDVYYYQFGYKWNVSDEESVEYLNPDWFTEYYVYPQSVIDGFSNPLHPNNNSTTPVWVGRNLLFRRYNNADVYIIAPNDNGGSLKRRKFDSLDALYYYGYPAGTADHHIIVVSSSAYSWIQSNYSLGDVIYAPQPNLEVQNESVSPTSVESGSSVYVSCRVKNTGDGSAGSSTLKYYLSSNTSYDGNDDYLAQDAVQPLSPNGSNDGYANVNIPSDTNSGNWYILFIADANNQVDESNENDNLEYCSLTIHCAPTANAGSNYNGRAD